MRWTLLLLIGLALAACSSGGSRDTPAEGYRNWWDRTRVALRLEGVLGYACTRSVRDKGGKAVMESLPLDQCYRFNRPERIEGVWLNDFEGSVLLTPKQYASGQIPDDHAWLEISGQAPQASREYPMQTAYQVAFVGRRASHAGSYGHLGMSRRLVLVDRMLSIRPISPSK